jgi:hypothetical protein
MSSGSLIPVMFFRVEVSYPSFESPFVLTGELYGDSCTGILVGSVFRYAEAFLVSVFTLLIFGGVAIAKRLA